MKNLIKVGLSAIVILVVCSGISARPKSDFDAFIKNAEQTIKNYSTDEFYEKYEFTNKKTGIKKKFSDFSNIEKQVFMVMQGQHISQSLLEVGTKWEEELKKAEETPTENSEASKKDVENYMTTLLNLRKVNAEKLEKMAEELFKNNPMQFSKEEQEFVLKNIRDFNDKHNLVVR